MNDFVFSDASKKLVSDYLDKAADIALGGSNSSFFVERLNYAGRAALHQMLFDNPEITGFEESQNKVNDERNKDQNESAL